MSENSEDWILRPRPNEKASLRLFCVPHAGGSAMAFRTWTQDLPDHIEVCAIELPGHGRRIKEGPYSQLKSLLAALVELMLPHNDRPYALFGHSFGALVCFELARELQNHKALPPVQLCVSGAKAPNLFIDDSTFHKQPDSQLIDEVRRLRGTPEAVLENEEMVSAMLPAIRADYEMLDTYVYTDADPLSCPILCLAGSADPQVERDSLQAWAEHTTAGFNMVMFPGDHFYLFRAQTQVLKTLSTALEQVLPLVEDQ
jgi:medium-chain acyl-[acyl-carrier-protein] hydrolase